MIKHRIAQWSINLSKKLSREGMYPFLEGQFAKIPANASVLNIGAGGEIESMLKQFAESTPFTIVSFDIDAERKPDLVGDICTYEFNGQFDVVIMSEVLEHVHSPHLAIENVYNILQKGGKLILTTPFIFPLHDRPYDYYRFTKYGLQHLLKPFSHVQIFEKNGYFEAIDVLWVRLWREESKRARTFSYLMIPLIYFLKRPFSRLLSSIIKADGISTGYLVTAYKL